MSRGFVFRTWNHQPFWRHGRGLPCSRPWLPTRSCYDVWRWCLSPDSNNAPQESIWMGRQTSPQGGTRFRMLRAQFWTLAQSKYISEGTQKWTLLGSKVVPPGGPVFGPFILSDVLKLCKLLCAQNVKREATLTQTASVAGILNCSRPWLPTRSCYDVWRWCLSPDSNNAPQESIWMGRQTSPQGGTRFRMLRAQFWTLARSKYISEGTQKWTLLGSKVVPPGGLVFGPFILSDVLKLCKLLCAQNVKLEATLTQTASVAGILNCSRPWLPTRSCYDVWRWCLSPDSNNAPQESIWMGRQTSPQGGTRFRMLRAQFWTLAQSKYISEGTQKWTLLGSKVVPPGGPVFGPFILSDVLKLCKLLCAQNVKLEATLTQTASVAGILNCSRPWLPTRSCYDVWRWCLSPDSNNAPQESIWMGRPTSPQGGTRFRMLRAQFWTLAQSKYISEGTQKWTLLGSKVVPPGGPVFGPFILSDVLKLCKLLCAQNVKLEATFTQTWQESWTGEARICVPNFSWLFRAQK